MKRVLLLTTGGTISSRMDPGSGAVVPLLSGDELAGLLSTTADIKIDVKEISRVGGSQITPELGFRIAEDVKQALSSGRYTGVVVTQGTDSIEEISYLVDLLVDSQHPVVHTAAMRNHSDLGNDGPRNLSAAVQVAASSSAKGHGVLVVMNDYIYAASEVMKTDTVNPASFAAPERGPLGVVMRRGPIFFHKTLTRQHIPAPKLELNVPVVRICLGMDGCLVDAAVSAGAKGLVLEGNGVGNIPESAVSAIDRILATRLPVVITSSCVRGIVDDLYGYPGGGHELCQRGAILGQGLTAPKARIKLMVALGAGCNLEEIRALFEYLG